MAAFGVKPPAEKRESIDAVTARETPSLDRVMVDVKMGQRRVERTAVVAPETGVRNPID
jgi:hypothetical protein